MQKDEPTVDFSEFVGEYTPDQIPTLIDNMQKKANDAFTVIIISDPGDEQPGTHITTMVGKL